MSTLMDADDQRTEPHTHSFVVKVWVETASPSARHHAWRGYITHVASGRRRYITHLNELTTFVVPYLTELQAQVPLLWRIRSWLSRSS